MNPIDSKYIILIVGPTAVGKTRVAIDLAKVLNTEIISADSRQCYQEMNIGVARPSKEDLLSVKHHFIATHSVPEPLTAASFETEALNLVRELFKTKRAVVMVGGTGLYIRAFCEGLDQIPAIPDTVKVEIRQQYELHGLKWLQEQLAIKDPAFLAKAEAHNPHRLMRALEVLEATGHSILHYQQGTSQVRPFRIIKIGLDLPRQQLYRRIDERVLQMMDQGLEEEARSLLRWRHLSALQTVGYQEMFQYFDGSISRERAIELIQQHSRNYAKRQLTWFRRDPDIKWFSPDNLREMLEYASEQMR
ncbi:MAG: tRNA (adenosine(37)-N6)-dimethylallyltransferase MiaA [Chitinophagaceae bacterium]